MSSSHIHASFSRRWLGGNGIRRYHGITYRLNQDVTRAKTVIVEISRCKSNDMCFFFAVQHRDSVTEVRFLSHTIKNDDFRSCNVLKEDHQHTTAYRNAVTAWPFSRKTARIVSLVVPFPSGSSTLWSQRVSSKEFEPVNGISLFELAGDTLQNTKYDQSVRINQ